MRLTFLRLLDDPLPYVVSEPVAFVPEGTIRSFWTLNSVPPQQKVELAVESSRPFVAKAKFHKVGIQTRLDVMAKSPGQAFLRFFEKNNPGNRCVDQLEILVYPLVEVIVNIFLVTDGHGDTSSASHAQIVSELAEVNNLVTPQANIRFKVRLKSQFKTQADLKRKGLQSYQIIGLWKDLMEHARRLGSPAEEVSLFIVKYFGAFDLESEGSDVRGMGVPGVRLCIMEDNPNRFLHMRAIAHELLHSLGACHDKFHPEPLMFPSSKVTGTKIYPRTVYECHTQRPGFDGCRH